MRCYKLTITTVLLFVGFNLCAQTPWTLEQCINHALENNIQIKQQQLLVEQNKNNLTQSKYALIPNLSSGVDYSMGWGRTLDLTDYKFVDGDRNGNGSFSVRASTPLFAGLQKQNTIKKNNIDLKASIQDVERLKNDIALNVAAAYLQVLLAKEGVAIAEQQLESTKEQVSKTDKLVKAGSLTLSNYLDLQAQQAGNESQLITAQNNLAIAVLSLKQLLELSGDQNFDIITPEILSIPEQFADENLQTMYNDALNSMPEIKSNELRLQSAEKSLAIARGAYYPSLSLSGSYSTSYSDTRAKPGTINDDYPFSEQWNDNRNTGVGLGLSIPIFSGLQTRTQVKNAKLNIKNSALELQRTKNTLYKSIQQAQTDANGYLKSYQASLKNVQANEEALKYTERKLNAGSVTSTDYIVAKNNLFKAQSECIQAKYQYVFKMKILDFYKGLPITL